MARSPDLSQPLPTPSESADPTAPIDLARLMQEARGRLAALARLRGIPPDGVDDVVQETLFLAWKNLGTLREQASIDRWLDGICRNVCRHMVRDLRWHLAHNTHASDGITEAIEAIPDPDADDLAEALDRRDREVLIERALSYLPAASRMPITLCHLRELPQRDAAQQLGISVAALEARLHRARLQLRQVLVEELADEARALGWLSDPADATIWHTSRIWCFACGQRYLEGRFYRTRSGKQSLMMRCPVCVLANGARINIGEVDWLEGIHTFRPALKRLWRYGPEYLSSGIRGEQRQSCVRCGGALRFAVVMDPERWQQPGMSGHFIVTYTCPRCGDCDSSDAVLAIMHLPGVAHFRDAHPRLIMRDEQSIDFSGRPAIQFTLAAVTSGEQLTIITDRATLEPLASFSS